ncbi:hypothetical protein GE21DRAFT_54 [Neurospora crassa]|uniref:Uncharacterized protein n=1 Tax=Neurospora crassa (strain ATCC 24698 / 74-OR23-1A / CBS 708.71 / DSM 1257 / FGSC 987) TaxID=367110 RepID=Q7SGJ9_NEUCR|nr:hypothetical protein NCU08085 [Neurospora crassa OR74A]EAA35980.1 hypothetical protein NCU08085 [Neurospora crassa OR74A]KHE84545.1 hypothetical protein GE21DRAFT_54 [Neurospora crassa]|eukprot:XP_965216.1 hypothetical protein NCU08085 [Neurospora crassa OR74A]
MALTTTFRPSLQLVVYLGLVWACGMVTLCTAQTTTFADNYQGIFSPIDGTKSPVTCPSTAIFRTWSTLAACCWPEMPDCYFATRCDGGTMYEFYGSSWTCDQGHPNCFTMTIYDRFPSHNKSWIEMNCATRWSAYTIYREFEDSITSTSMTPTTTPSASTSEPSLTSAVTTPTSSSPFLTDAPIDPKPSTSKAWIAGPVAGGIVALLLLGALFFWWRRRKSGQESSNTPSMAQTGTAGGYFPEYVGSPHENDHTPQLNSPSSPPAAPYHPSNSPPHYSSHSPGPHDAFNTSPYKYPASGTSNTTSWQGSPRPVSELDATGMRHQHTIAEAP